MSVIHVNHIAAALRQRFRGKIDLSDVSSRQADDQESFFLTRALAAFTIAELSKTDDDTAAASIVDGGSDNGIDAFYFDRAERICYVAQSKFIKSGNGTMDRADTLKVAAGVKDLLEFKLDRFKKLANKKSDIEAALSDSNAKFVIACAYTGQQELADEVMAPLDELLANLNDVDDLVSLKILNQKRLWEVVSSQAMGQSIDLTIMLHEWGIVRQPFLAYYGQVAVGDVLKWADFGDRLYHKNIRSFKGSTDVNDGIVSTIQGSPQNFWYFNNGITILCSELAKQPLGGESRMSGVFDCRGASVVNGAQTVGSIIAALKGGVDGADNGRILVRLISLENCPPDFGSQLTRAANTQNRIDKKDFASLDPQQARLATELMLSFQKEYVYRSGERQTAHDQGCTLDEATLALACAQRDVALAVQAKREVGRLYDDIQGTPYTLLFNSSVTAQRLWRSVEIMRAVEAALVEAEQLLDGKDRLIAIHGNRFLLHLVFGVLGEKKVNESTETTFDLGNRAKLAAVRILPVMTEVATKKFPSAYAANLFKNATKCKQLVEAVRAVETAPAGPSPLFGDVT